MPLFLHKLNIAKCKTGCFVISSSCIYFAFQFKTSNVYFYLKLLTEIKISYTQRQVFIPNFSKCIKQLLQHSLSSSS